MAKYFEKDNMIDAFQMKEAIEIRKRNGTSSWTIEPSSWLLIQNGRVDSINDLGFKGRFIAYDDAKEIAQKRACCGYSQDRCIDSIAKEAKILSLDNEIERLEHQIVAAREELRKTARIPSFLHDKQQPHCFICSRIYSCPCGNKKF